MKFAMKMIVGGILAALLGVVWLGYGFAGGDADGVFTGGLWKGPLLMAAGAGAVIMGFRMLRDDASPQE